MTACSVPLCGGPTGQRDRGILLGQGQDVVFTRSSQYGKAKQVRQTCE